MELLQTHSIEPGMLLGHEGEVASHVSAAIKVIARYPFDHPDAEPRWVIEHVRRFQRLEVVPEHTLRSLYPLLLAHLLVKHD